MRNGRREEIVAVLRGLILAQPFDFAWNDEVFVLAQRNAVLGRESFGALSHKIHVRAFAQNLPGGTHGIAQVLDAAHSTCA